MGPEDFQTEISAHSLHPGGWREINLSFGVSMSKKSLRELVDDNLGKPTGTSLSDELHIREL